MLKKIKLFLLKFKSTKIWYYFLLYFFLPIYDFFWQFVFNFEGKIYYFLWKLKNKDSFNLNNNDKIIINNNSNFKKIAKDLNDFVNEDFQNNIIKEFKKNLNLENVQNKFEDYRVDLFKLLPIPLKQQIIDFALHEKNITTSANYLKVFPIIGKIYFFLNFPSFGNKEKKGAMLWHKDDFGYKSLDLFLAVNKIDENNGQLYFVKEKEPLGVFYKLTNVIQNALPGERNKINIDNFSKNFSNDKIDSLHGEAGNAVFIDSFTSYHRGGHCISKNRLMLRICYQTPDSIDVQNKLNTNGFSFFTDIKKENTKNKFYRYLFFKRYGNFWKFIQLPNILIILYKALHYKV